MEIMFLENFIFARDYLSHRGLKPALKMGSPVSERDLDVLDAETDSPLPAELREFYLEMGDGFEFVPDENPDSKWTGWEQMWLSDHKICNIGFCTQIEEEANTEIARSKPRTPVELLRQEMEKRKRWMPFYSFAGGGNYLCLDLSVTPPAVRFYEALYWVAIPQSWSLLIASSFTEFVREWSRHYFLTPSGEWTSFCRDRSGRFDWHSKHFPQINERAQSQ
jgi:hypothetical protein